jgi:hypothetical protein
VVTSILKLRLVAPSRHLCSLIQPPQTNNLKNKSSSGNHLVTAGDDTPALQFLPLSLPDRMIPLFTRDELLQSILF